MKKIIYLLVLGFLIQGLIVKPDLDVDNNALLGNITTLKTCAINEFMNGTNGTNIFCGQVPSVTIANGSAIIKVRNELGFTINSGTPVYWDGWNVGQSAATIQLASSESVDTHMDCMTSQTIANGNTGSCVISGQITSLDTSDFSTDDEIYLNKSAGTITNIKPDDVPCIQKLGMIAFANPSVGVIVIHGAGRCNDVPVNASFTYLDIVLADITNALNFVDAPIQNVSYIEFNASDVSPDHQEGILFYDNDAMTLAMYNDEIDVTLQIGQESWIRVKNVQGTQIDNGDAIYISGSTGGNIEIKLAIANETIAAHVDGLATHDIPNNEFGYITTFGLVRGLDTSMWSEGDVLYLNSTSYGDLQNTPPTPFNFIVRVGTVAASHLTQGSIALENIGVDYTNGVVINNLYAIGDANATRIFQGSNIVCDNANIPACDVGESLNSTGGCGGFVCQADSGGGGGASLWEDNAGILSPIDTSQSMSIRNSSEELSIGFQCLDGEGVCKIKANGKRDIEYLSDQTVPTGNQPFIRFRSRENGEAGVFIFNNNSHSFSLVQQAGETGHSRFRAFQSLAFQANDDGGDYIIMHTRANIVSMGVIGDSHLYFNDTNGEWETLHAAGFTDETPKEAEEYYYRNNKSFLEIGLSVNNNGILNISKANPNIWKVTNRGYKFKVDEQVVENSVKVNVLMKVIKNMYNELCTIKPNMDMCSKEFKNLYRNEWNSGYPNNCPLDTFASSTAQACISIIN